MCFLLVSQVLNKVLVLHNGCYVFLDAVKFQIPCFYIHLRSSSMDLDSTLQIIYFFFYMDFTFLFFDKVLIKGKRKGNEKCYA